MPARSALVDHCLELLAPLGEVSARPMFGGHGLYIDGLFVALIAVERLYLKTDAQTRPQFEAAGCEPFVYETRGRPVTVAYWTVPPQAMESPAFMQPWARLAVDAALRARTVPARPRRSAGPAAKPPTPKAAARRATRGRA
jgi:DNA transformation protein and related proteins